MTTHESNSSRSVTIRAENLSKIYGDFAALHSVTFQVRKGTVAAFLGPNGAGKSTTMKILTGYLAPTAGRAEVLGFDPTHPDQRIEMAQRLGYLPDSELRRALSEATVGLFPYRAEIDLSGALLQTLGAGVPAIVYDIGGLGELVGRFEAGAVVPPGDVDEMAADARRRLEHEGFAPAQQRLVRSVDVRYRGQAFELNVGVDETLAVETIEADFHRQHRATYGHANPEAVVELVNARLIAYGLDPIYNLTKHAVLGLTRGTAAQLAPQGITVNCVCPGVVDTPLVGEARAMLEAAGFPMIPASQVADAVHSALTEGRTGEAWMVLAGQPNQPHEFPDFSALLSGGKRLPFGPQD